jgi:fructuronate reductase
VTASHLHRGSSATPPVRALHLGLGSFFRAHQAWYTDRAADADEWGIAAFTGRRPDLARALEAQDGLYTLVTRGAEGDACSVVRSVSAARAADDHDAWLRLMARPEVQVLTITVTEAGYGAGGAPARIVAGLQARRASDAGPLTLVPCDNLPDNGGRLAAVLRDVAGGVDASLVGWMDEHVSTVTTMVDRITPATTDEDRAAVRAATGVEDSSPVVTEPFTEWVLSGAFAGDRPAWETAGARFVDDVRPHEERKLWLLNGAHSLLAYTGRLRGRTTVAEAIADPTCRSWVESWWDCCAPYLALPASEVDGYRAALLERYANPRIRHTLAQIAVDGSQKLPVRFLPVLGRERAAGRLPEAAVTVLAAWVLHLRDGTAVQDVRAAELAPLASGPLEESVRRLVAALDPALADDVELLAAVRATAAELEPR